MKKFGILTIILVLGLLYSFSALIREGGEFRRISLDYYLLIDSEYVINFPLPEKPIKIRYGYSSGGGHTGYQSISVYKNSFSQKYIAKVGAYLAMLKVMHTTCNDNCSFEIQRYDGELFLRFMVTE